MKRGEIYLLNFGKKYNSEFGKIRPAVIVQNNIANRNIDKVAFKGITLMPLTTNIAGGSVRVFVNSRDKLKNDSEICINELCTLDISRIDFDNYFTTLNDSEIDELNTKLIRHLEL